MTSATPRTQRTPNGLRVGDKVTFTKPSIRHEHGVFVVTGHDTLRVRLNDAQGHDLGWAVNYYELTPASDAAKVEDLRAGIARKAEPLYLVCRAGRHIVKVQEIGSPRSPVYRVEATIGNVIVEDLTRSYATEAEAREVARAITITLREIDRLETAIAGV
jgi:hypothetical protein